MFLAASPLIGSLGILGIALGVCFVLLVMVRSRHLNLEGPAADPVEDLTYRLRHPAMWTVQHPARAIRRTVKR